jgi:hypothetical protein
VSSRFEEVCTTELPENTDTSVYVACKASKNVPVFYNRTAGVMAMVKPCGIVISAAELLTYELASQLFVHLLRLVLDSTHNIQYFGYDRGCEFAPFLTNLSKKGNKGASILLERLEFLVDRFHIKGHTTPQCDLKSPLCLYHPDLLKFQAIRNANTECAEQAFSWLGKFKYSLKYMSQFKYKFFLSMPLLKNDHILGSEYFRLA